MLANHYNDHWVALNAHLKHQEQTKGSLTGALLELELHQKRAGFIKDDLHEIRRFIYVHSVHPFCYLRVQFNPRRALRFNGSGITRPSDGMSSVNNGCFLCRENVQWQQQGKEIGYEIEVLDTMYHAWMNPFPLLPCHVVISTQQHVTQEWELHPQGSLPLETLVGNLVALAKRMPGFIGFYNGIGAGASIPGHMHYQFCMRPEDTVHFPLEQAERDYTSFDHTGIVRDYPLTVAAWTGSAESVVTNAVDWVRYWADHNRAHMEHLTGNFITTMDEETGDISLFFAPRDRRRPKSQHMSGLVGGLEVMGELVFSSEEERMTIDDGNLNYRELLKIYNDIYTPFFLDEPARLGREL
jgi:hypothetical protein